MIVKILSKTPSFNAVKYNTNKIKTGDGELMCHENFPILKNYIPETAVIKNYLKAVSSTNNRVKNPQFHATISCKGDEFDKHQLTEIARDYMSKMGYEKQPFIVVFHNDTDNNHVHIVSTRVKTEGKKISDRFENLRSQRHLQKIMQEKFGIDEKLNVNKLLKYNASSFQQMVTLFERNGFDLVEKEGQTKVYKAGIFITDAEVNLTERNKSRQKQLQQIFKDYSKTYDCKITETSKGHWKSEMTDKLKSSLGLDIMFHVSKKTNEPFGYTLIDNSKQNIFKGSEIFDIKYFKGELQTEDLLQVKDRGEVTNNYTQFPANTQKEDSLNVGGLLSSIFSSSGGGSNDPNNDDEQQNTNKRKRKR